MKSLRKMLMLVAGAGLLVVVSVMSIAAAPNTAEIPNDIPATALYVDGMSHAIAGNSSMWYKFDYSTANPQQGQRTPVQLTLVDGTNKGVMFDVYSASQIANWWQDNPVGRGTSQGYNGVQSKNLTWDGMFQANGVQYVKITNTSPNAATFTLMRQ